MALPSPGHVTLAAVSVKVKARRPGGPPLVREPEAGGRPTQPTFTKHGDSDPIFGDSATGQPPDPSLDTGHYDDGHAFGWNIKTKSDVIDAEHQAIEDILGDEPQKLIGDLELAAGVDLNGSGQQVTTIVGPPVIT